MSDRRSVVAIVDDDLRLLESMEELLESAGYVARGFPSAESLLESELAEFDMLITDIGMPRMDGFALRDRVLAARPQLPVLLMTGATRSPTRTAPATQAGTSGSRSMRGLCSRPSAMPCATDKMEVEHAK